jgi:hypothetical protein
MHNFSSLKLGFIAAIFLLASCSSDLPDTPKFEFCKFEIEGQAFCKSFYEVSKEFCSDYEGTIVETCEEGQ